jgi:hypothetical protein
VASDKVKRGGRRRRSVLHEEDLNAAIKELSDFADDQAGKIRRKNKGRVYRFNDQRKPDVDALLETSLREALEDEIVPAVELQESRILPHEFEQEVIKKALVALRAETLRKLARHQKLAAAGSLEELATRIGQTYRWNRSEIARLILENEPEPSAERAHSERLFPLGEAPDLAYVADRLDYVLGRYIRTGIARWFVFEHLDADGAEVVLRGTLRAFRADVTNEEGTPSVVAVPRIDHSVEIVVDRSSTLRVRRANSFEASAAAKAFALATKVHPLGYVPVSTAGISGGPAAAFAPGSLFMLDLLTARFGRAGLHDRNLTIARFRMDRREEGPGDDDAFARPRLNAVRFEGTHLLDSAPACKLLADEGRALVDASLTVMSPPRPDGESARFPVRVGIENDHIFVLTGFGVAPEISFAVHEAVVEAAREEIEVGLADAEALAALAVRVQERAHTTVPVDRADMLDTGD